MKRKLSLISLCLPTYQDQIISFSKMINMTQDSSEIEFNLTSGDFGPIKIVSWDGIIGILMIILLGLSAIVTLIANVIPIHFITKQPSETRRPIDILLLYDQVRLFFT